MGLGRLEALAAKVMDLWRLNVVDPFNPPRGVRECGTKVPQASL
jgi:hypothetical protein